MVCPQSLDKWHFVKTRVLPMAPGLVRAPPPHVLTRWEKTSNHMMSNNGTICLEAPQRLIESKGILFIWKFNWKWHRQRYSRTCRSPASRVEPTHLKRLVDAAIIIHQLSLAGFTLGTLESRESLSQSLGQEGPEGLKPTVVVPVPARTRNSIEHLGLSVRMLKALQTE